MLRGVGYITVAAASLLVAGCSGGDPDVSAPEAINSSPEEFRSAVLADGTVTRAELEQAYGHLFQCLHDGGAEGMIWFQPELSSSYASALSVRAADGSFPADSAQAEALYDEVVGGCERSYVEQIQQTYAAANPESGLTQRRLSLARECLAENAPHLHELTEGLDDLVAIDEIAFDNAVGSEVQIVQLCTQQYGHAMVELDDLVTSRPVS